LIFHYFCAVIKIENVSVQYQHETPVRNLSFVVNKGEKVCLTGPSGCGKSTLLNAIPGFVPLAEGNIEVDNLPLTVGNCPQIRQKIAWLPQELNLELDTVKNLLLYPFAFKENKKNIPDRKTVLQLFEKLLLDENVYDKSLAEISGGQKQRVAIVSVLLLKKSVMLLDEPSSALDDEATEVLADYILSLENTTVISASHDKRWIDRMDGKVFMGLNREEILN
jgi:putative ABC transport system ATP-binding protein